MSTSLLCIRTALSCFQKELVIPTCRQFHISAVREGGGKRPKKRRSYTKPTSRTRLSTDVVSHMESSSRREPFKEPKSQKKGGAETGIPPVKLDSESPEQLENSQEHSGSKHRKRRRRGKRSTTTEFPPAEPEPLFSRDAAPHHGIPEKQEPDEPVWSRFGAPKHPDIALLPYANDRKSSPIQSYANGSRPWRRISDRMKEIRQRAEAEAARRATRTPDNSDIPLPTERPKADPPLKGEFDLLQATGMLRKDRLPEAFTSPPLLEGLRASVFDFLGTEKRPTSIQALSLQNLFERTTSWKQYLLASETGSGKSIAYFLPLLQDLKYTELNPSSTSKLDSSRAINPRSLVLAPTHELCRQLSSFGKALIHNIKLRVMCTSRANIPSTPAMSFTSSKMLGQFRDYTGGGEFEVRKSSHRAVDVLVGTPNRLLEMSRGRGWNREESEDRDSDDNLRETPSDRWHRRPPPPPELGLQNIEWVVVDEADVLFDPDFQEYTRMLLADISAARGHPVEFTPNFLPSVESPRPKPIEYPFNFILTSATIPTSLTAYLDEYHPSLVHLASPNLHHLPARLKTIYSPWTGSNKDADIARQIRNVWAEDSVSPDFDGKWSKILIFCNRGSKVESLGAYLEANEIRNVALSGSSDARHVGSNRHLDGFLRVRQRSSESSVPSISPPASSTTDDEPHVLITTSLLSRGLDFSPSVKYVFIVDEPRNMIDFLHRAGRSGRAGHDGKVVMFVNSEGRGSDRSREIKKKIRAVRGIHR